MSFLLRPWSADDAPALVNLLSDPRLSDNLRDLPTPYTVSDAANFIRFARTAPPTSHCLRAVEVDGEVAGSIGVTGGVNIHAHTGELGYYLAKRHWGKGIATGAVRQICREMFEKTDLLRIFAEPFLQNTGSRRVLEKAGFVLEGILRQNAVKNGQVIDMCMYALLRQEFEESYIFECNQKGLTTS